MGQLFEVRSIFSHRALQCLTFFLKFGNVVLDRLPFLLLHVGPFGLFFDRILSRDRRCRFFDFLFSGLALFLSRNQQIFTYIAKEYARFALIVQNQKLIGHFIQEIAVMRNGDDGSAEAVQVILQYRQRIDVQVVRRLIHQQHIRFRHQQLQQVKPTLFPS
ncbi:hypothetical protein SDC9_190517 [bioreactor metagenome]|uniref:Uncharacterized protein n=1 Tax=bioreactor metagenome TaxID=1076179 RepID=A0A645HXP0_9ZZZZ